jgi:hypothetical protein
MAQATEKAVFTNSFLVAADLSSYQYHGVKLNGTDRTVAVIAAITDIPCGVLLNKPDASGREAEVMVVGLAPVVLEETLTSGQLISFNANGHAILAEAGTDTTVYPAGQITIGGASGETGEALINCAAPTRAA